MNYRTCFYEKKAIALALHARLHGMALN